MERSAIVIPARTKGKKVERSSGCCVAKYFYLDVTYAGVYADGHVDQLMVWLQMQLGGRVLVAGWQ